MSADEDGAAQAEHLHHPLSAVDHRHREDFPRRHSRREVSVLLFLSRFRLTGFTRANGKQKRVRQFGVSRAELVNISVFNVQMYSCETQLLLKITTQM